MSGINNQALKQSIGSQVKRYRNSASLTQAELAERVDKSVDTITFLEMGRTLPSIATLSTIANALGVDLADLLRADSNPRETATRRIQAILDGLSQVQQGKVVKILELIASELRSVQEQA